MLGKTTTTKEDFGFRTEGDEDEETKATDRRGCETKTLRCVGINQVKFQGRIDNSFPHKLPSPSIGVKFLSIVIINIIVRERRFARGSGTGVPEYFLTC